MIKATEQLSMETPLAWQSQVGNFSTISTEITGTYTDYDAAKHSKSRKRVSTRIRSRDDALNDQHRNRVTNTAIDLFNNYSVAAWACRRHLDYVSSFNFQATNDNEELNNELEGLVAWWSRPLNFDAAGRHSLPAFVRMCEMLSVLDGDCLPIKLNNGRMSLVESDRIRTPGKTKPTNGEPNAGDFDETRVVNGVQITRQGRAQRFAVHRRERSGSYTFDRWVRAGDALHIGYFDRYDQVRGISPLTSALNLFRDSYEATEYALAKMKVSQLLGFVTKRADAEFEDEIDLSGGLFNVDLGTDEDLNIVESNQPSTQYREFMGVVINAAFKALDIPYSFFDESHTNYSGSRLAAIHYEKACEHKRERLHRMLMAMTIWRLNLWIAEGILTLPAGMRVADLKFDWLHTGTPWIDPAKEITAAAKAVELGIATRSEIRKMRNGDSWLQDVYPKLQAEHDLMRALEQ